MGRSDGRAGEFRAALAGRRGCPPERRELHQASRAHGGRIAAGHVRRHHPVHAGRRDRGERGARAALRKTHGHCRNLRPTSPSSATNRGVRRPGKTPGPKSMASRPARRHPMAWRWWTGTTTATARVAGCCRWRTAACCCCGGWRTTRAASTAPSPARAERPGRGAGPWCCCQRRRASAATVRAPPPCLTPRAVRLTPGRAADSPRAVQLDSDRVGIVFMNKEGVHYLQAALADLV